MRLLAEEQRWRAVRRSIIIVVIIIGRDERPQLLRPCRIALELLRAQGHRAAMEATEEEE
jgi:hypothetical protein